MFYDENWRGFKPKPLYDVCIIGAGPAGITLAVELAKNGVSIFLGESGGLASATKADALDYVESVGHPANLAESRFRGFGGSSGKWGGRCATLDELDLENRDWIAGSGWPLKFADLEPYYDRAKTILNFRQPWLADSLALSQLAVGSLETDGADIMPYIWRVPPPYDRKSWANYLLPSRAKAFNFGRAYRKHLTRHESVHILVNATLVSLCTSHDGRKIRSVKLKSRAGKSISINASHFIICCNGIENARILLQSPPEMLKRINKHDNIGRFLAQHPRGIIGEVKTNQADAHRLQRLFNVHRRPPRTPVEYTTGLALTEVSQRRNKLVNASVSILYEANPQSAWAALKRIKQSVQTKTRNSTISKDCACLIARLPIINLARRYLLGREIYYSNPTISVEIHLEQAPNRESRIYLSDTRDELGVRRAIVDWKISAIELETIRFFARALQLRFRQLELGQVKIAPWVDSDDATTAAELSGNEHHMGTTRMAVDPINGVVDQNCKVHGVDNLFIGGASVFPIAGHANPTLTIVALSIRLADHLRSALGR